MCQMWSLVDWFLSSASQILTMRQFHHLQKFILLAVLKAINFHHGSRVPYVVSGKLTEEGGMDLSSGGVRGAGHSLSAKSRRGTSLAVLWLRSSAGDITSIPHAWILCATTKARSSQINT